MPAPMPPQQAASADVHTPMLLSEARQQNTEVRLTLSKLYDKVEKMADKVSRNSGLLLCWGLPSLVLLSTSHEDQHWVCIDFTENLSVPEWVSHCNKHLKAKECCH